MEKVKAGFVEKIGSTVFIVNAMPSENASDILTVAADMQAK